MPRWVICPAQTGTLSPASTSRTCVTNGDSVLSRRAGTALITSANGFLDWRAKSMVSFTAARSNTASRTGMTTKVASLIASVTAPDMFGGVSTNAHSTPSARACATVSLMPRIPLRSCGSAVPRSLCQSEIDPCGSASISMQRRDGRFACAARCAVSVLLPEPPLREAKTMTFMRAGPDSVDLAESSMTLDSALRGINEYPDDCDSRMNTPPNTALVRLVCDEETAKRLSDLLSDSFEETAAAV